MIWMQRNRGSFYRSPALGNYIVLCTATQDDQMAVLSPFLHTLLNQEFIKVKFQEGDWSTAMGYCILPVLEVSFSSLCSVVILCVLSTCWNWKRNASMVPSSFSIWLVLCWMELGVLILKLLFTIYIRSTKTRRKICCLTLGLRWCLTPVLDSNFKWKNPDFLTEVSSMRDSDVAFEISNGLKCLDFQCSWNGLSKTSDFQMMVDLKGLTMPLFFYDICS